MMRKWVYIAGVLGVVATTVVGYVLYEMRPVYFEGRQVVSGTLLIPKELDDEIADPAYPRGVPFPLTQKDLRAYVDLLEICRYKSLTVHDRAGPPIYLELTLKFADGTIEKFPILIQGSEATENRPPNHPDIEDDGPEEIDISGPEFEGVRELLHEFGDEDTKLR